MVWYGARALLNGVDPWSVIGPSLPFNYEWRLIYPGTALVAVMPFAVFSEAFATALFVGASSWFLAFGITRDGWHRVPLFMSLPFLSSVRLGQWSILFSAALYFPALAFFTVVKPQAAIPVLASSRMRSTFVAAIAGALVLIPASLILEPHWPARWLASASTARYIQPPIINFPGVAVLLCLSRWKRHESWIVLTLACLPHSWGWYSPLILFTIPASLAESLLLCAATLAGAWYADNYVAITTPDAVIASIGSVINATIFVPATLMILRRPNEGPLPAWLGSFRRTRK
jgi:hypothetical protein